MKLRAPSVGTVVDGIRLLAGLGGIGLVSYGAWLHYPPLGFAVAGGLCLVIALVGALRAK